MCWKWIEQRSGLKQTNDGQKKTNDWTTEWIKKEEKKNEVKTFVLEDFHLKCDFSFEWSHLESSNIDRHHHRNKHHYQGHHQGCRQNCLGSQAHKRRVPTWCQFGDRKTKEGHDFEIWVLVPKHCRTNGHFSPITPNDCPNHPP